MRILFVLAALVGCASALAQTASAPASATARATSQPALSKAERIFIERGLQIHGLGFEDSPFSVATLKGANFTGVNWGWKPKPDAMGKPPGEVYWNYWTSSENETSLAPESQPYAAKLVALQLRDEQDMNNPDGRAAAARWFEIARKNFPNTILYTNQYGSHQFTSENMLKYWEACKPDMLSFDTYPMLEGADNWMAFYGDAQRYRKLALGWGVPCAMWIQTFHGENRYRDPSESEMRLNQFAAWTFGYKMVTAFTYNAGSSNLFKGPGDRNPKPAYGQIRKLNRESLNLGPALVRLKSVDVRFVRGQHREGGKTVDNPLPVDVQAWQYNVNDPFIRGFTVENIGTKNDKLKGDLVIGWFKPLEMPAGAEPNREIYFMITNGLCDRTAIAAGCRQRITVNLHFLDTGITSLQRLSRLTGKVEQVELKPVGEAGRHLLTFELDGGTGDLFKFNTGSAFVGGQQ
jgi:hypothetical protein